MPTWDRDAKSGDGEKNELTDLIETPAYVIDQKILKSDLTLLRAVADRASCKLLYSPKASSLATVITGAAPLVDGFACSSPFELRLVDRLCDGAPSLHLVSPLIRQETLGEFGDRLDHVTFNSLAQWETLRGSVCESTRVGLRINPELSFIRDPRYDPCRQNSKLGVPISQLVALAKQNPDSLRGIDGLHFHNNCESTDFASLLATARHIQDVIPGLLDAVDWINLGGGYLFDSVEGCAEFYEAVAIFQRIFDLEVLMEPGAAAVRRCGTIVATVHDIFDVDDCQVAVLDTSVNHMPEVLEFQFEPDVLGHVDGGVYSYVLTGCSCLAGDSFGHYSFDSPIDIGSKITFLNMGAYTASKAHRFNGIALPSVYVRRPDGTLDLVSVDEFDAFAESAGGSSIAVA